ncbi:hypothetical protein Tsubulata_006219 [Turnera subulata]|uniref:WD repeat-containing protein 75 second beta-propeller domain-containing protein n=1 Tax=Turnera subulata TaxID=218843 RepID=A0A9Q0J9K0_9ROSI|nr:hypothetical protein Tsubulata_006219 [Turnera subulata]
MIRGGRSYVSSPPAFSNDAKRLLVCSGNSVTIFSTVTGLAVASLEGHTERVTTVIVVPGTSPASKKLCYCWTASLDGTIRYWDFSLAELIRTIDIKLPIYSLVIPSILAPGQVEESNGKKAKIFGYVSVEDTKEITKRKSSKVKEEMQDEDDDDTVENQSSTVSVGRIHRCNLTDSRLVGAAFAETKRPEVITVSPSGRYCGVHSKRKIHIWEALGSDPKSGAVRKITLHHTKTVRALAFHPTQRIVAAGDVTGRILVWRGFGNRTFTKRKETGSGGSMDYGEENPGVRGGDDADSCTTWHWHPAGVNVLYFSSDGAYLYSGGKEGVLVVWQLDTGKKKFLPRIGSPLLWFTVSPDPSLSSISCADNQIHLLKMPSMEILKSISGIKLPCTFPEECKGLHAGVAFDHNNGLIALRAEDYCIQLYSLFDDRGISEVQVCERNHQPGDDITVVVTSVVLSPDGSMMSTAEVKLAEEGLGGLVCLKFWASGSQNKQFSLTTIVYEPHREAGISAIAFHPTRCMAVTSSYGGDFKVWTSNKGIQKTDQTLPNSGWTCHAVGSYKKKRMTAAAFSPDGSVLAVAAETVITLWDAVKNVLVAVVGDTLSPIVSLSFVDNSDYLVTASWGSKAQLSVWSMSKLSACWSYMLHVEGVASAVDSCFAVLALLPESSISYQSNETHFKARDGVILLFNSTDPVPVAMWSVNKAKGGSLAFVQVNQLASEGNNMHGKQPKALLAYVNGDHEYVLFDPHGEEANEHAIVRRERLTELEESGKYGYASIYGELPKFDLNREEISLAPSVPSERPWETIFSGPSHNLPPLTKLCSAFLESLLEKRTTTVE